MEFGKFEHAFFNQINESKDEHILVISGAIGESNYFYDATSAKDVRNALNNVEAKTIRIKLNSPGGDAFQGLEIYNYIKDLDAHVIVEVTALAASAGSIIAMGADEIIMRTGSTMMIHNASTFCYGDKEEMQTTYDRLEKIDSSNVDVYVSRTGLSKEEVKELLDNETWFTASEAVEKGFANSYETKEKDNGMKVKQDLNTNINNELVNQEVKDESNVNTKDYLKTLLF
ncbi:TPA: Clp protease ClpP [Staphylococcus aureus]|nr:Clp protease ClpP [Staphylococcus aureus]HDK7769786.1 Clp protease ClpP [Staphylococcus aureus]HDK7845917.1 Clp protease ClpP [Staphylococcus aureus]